jgi:hypothetical protein
MNKTATFGGAAAVGALVSLFSATGVSAAENISADVGVSYNTHFISYGLDVWGGGNDFYGDKSTTFVYGDLAIKATDALTFTLSLWSDINNNAQGSAFGQSAIGGHIQEIDFGPGFTYSFGKVTAGAVYNAWSYGGDVEQSVDLSLAFDDTGLLIPGVAFGPKVVWHDRFSGNGSQQIGSAVVLSVGPTFPLGEGFTIAIPAGVAFFTTDDFQGGTKSGYGFSYIGGSLGYGLAFVPEMYGKWSVNFDLIEYFTRKDAIPGNPEETFLTGSVGLKVAY